MRFMFSLRYSKQFIKPSQTLYKELSDSRKHLNHFLLDKSAVYCGPGSTRLYKTIGSHIFVYSSKNTLYWM